jgi:hypothetical protein
MKSIEFDKAGFALYPKPFRLKKYGLQTGDFS